ncbi:MAG TPA: hypothetical protein VLY24_26940 [Bryobacteraceae bacterium]|nr:hypothetical protein [Bryobacteraceae bacterium]
MSAPDDTTAIHILKTVARARLQSEASELPSMADLSSALTAAFDNPAPSPTSEGDLARAALDVLSQDPAFAEPIRIMASQPAAPPPRYTDPGTIAVITAALLVLQTRIKFKRDHSGKWSFEVDKKAASDSAVKLLVQRLLSMLGK